MFFGGVAFSQVPISDDNLSSRTDKPKWACGHIFQQKLFNFHLGY